MMKKQFWRPTMAGTRFWFKYQESHEKLICVGSDPKTVLNSCRVLPGLYGSGTLEINEEKYWYLCLFEGVFMRSENCSRN